MIAMSLLNLPILEVQALNTTHNQMPKLEEKNKTMYTKSYMVASEMRVLDGDQ